MVAFPQPHLHRYEHPSGSCFYRCCSAWGNGCNGLLDSNRDVVPDFVFQHRHLCRLCREQASSTKVTPSVRWASRGICTCCVVPASMKMRHGVCGPINCKIWWSVQTLCIRFKNGGFPTRHRDTFPRDLQLLKISLCFLQKGGRFCRMGIKSFCFLSNISILRSRSVA